MRAAKSPKSVTLPARIAAGLLAALLAVWPVAGQTPESTPPKHKSSAASSTHKSTSAAHKKTPTAHTGSKT
ncbi:MAG: hypothetical protein WCA11_18275, partial [Terracidiphilus sp.]